MKKMLLALAVAAVVTSGSAFAQEVTGGGDAGNNALGGFGTKAIGAAVVGISIAGAIVSNVNGSASDGGVAPTGPVVPPPPPPPPASCNGDDELVDGVCIGSTVTTTVTGTGTGTATSTITVTVPVTFTYTPTN